MKAFNHEQILFLFDFFNENGIDTALINKLPQRKERKPKPIPEIPPLDQFLDKAKEYCTKYQINYSEGLEVGIKMKYDAWLTSDWCVNVAGNLRPIRRWETTLLNTLPHIKPVPTSTNNTNHFTKVQTAYETTSAIWQQQYGE
jgi:hypothetical protein